MPTLFWLDKPDLQQLIERLESRGYQVVGPTVDQDAIVYDRLRSIDDLPRGWTDVQEPGRYRLERRDDDAWFGYVIGPHSWKKYLFPPVATLLTAERIDSRWEMSAVSEPPPRYAILGARACEVAAIAVQDRVFAGGQYVDPLYVARRERLLVIAVQCTQAASTCFCSSMGTGPECRTGFDLALTELPTGFVVAVGTPVGQSLVDELPVRLASSAECHAAAGGQANAAEQITRRLDTHDLRDVLMSRLDHPHWDEVANRCISCANCTLVCPTCFCSTVDEVTDLTGDHVQRDRRWDSCFNMDLAYMNGGPARPTIRSRYRQWLTHKLATWHDQFGESGCVGCGRCITWCPVGIDLTAEVAALRGAEAGSSGTPAAAAEVTR